MALDYGPCLSDLRGIRILRVVEAIWLEGPALLVFIVIGFLIWSIIGKSIAGTAVTFYTLVYFVIFAPRRTVLKTLIIIVLISTVQAAFQKTAWHPNFTSAQVSK
jgi:hypothetical protein